MDLTKIHIIPEMDDLDEYIELANKYGLHFEYNDLLNLK